MTQLTHFESVCEFMELMGQEVLTTETLPTSKLGILRHNLIAEEVDELADALANDDYVEIADALADILYVGFGAYAAFGIDPLEFRYARPAEQVERQAQLLTIGQANKINNTFNKATTDLMFGMCNDNISIIHGSLQDIIETAYSAAWQSGIDIFKCFKEVHASNMSKACLTLSDAERSLRLRLEDPATAAKYKDVEPVQVGERFVLQRKTDGKCLKGMHYFEPNLSQFLDLDNL